MAALLAELDLPAPGDDVLDLGCGAGAMAEALRLRLGPGARYVGFDVHAASVAWCRRRFADDPRFAFELARVASPFGSPGGAPADAYRFPMDDGEAGFVLAKSVFTHLRERECARYLSEIRRVLRPGRGAVVTAFLFDADGPGRAGAARAFPHGDADGAVRWRRRDRPESAVAYETTRFRALVAGAGLRVQWMCPGFHPGSDRIAGQDVLLLGH